ncbi:MAG TPA: mannose-1-phosphate guanylyltransferase [Tenacibaculum sp.]|nr:mannose-1-phosphate guanylyltransferase [Tenacibaculum sp.]
MESNYYAVIMAGGIGSRFWPVSTKKYPKQFHDMLGTGESLIQNTFNRINKLIPSRNILVATNTNYENLVLEHLFKIKKDQVLLEPVMRNTAPCILYAALKIYNENPDALMLVAPSDHWIENESDFLNNIQLSFDACTEKDILMTLGIEPESPNTGYGYIQFENDSLTVKKVKNFTEKPDIKKAEQFLNSGDFLWNAGIFVWSVKSIIKAFNEHLHEMVKVLDVPNIYNTELEKTFIKDNYEKCQNISIDFGIMEHAQNVFVLPANFGWNDIGTWGSLYHKLDKDNNNNAVVGAKTILNSSHGNMIRTENNKKVVIHGLDNFIIVEKDDILLICPRDNEQEIKEIAANSIKKFKI